MTRACCHEMTPLCRADRVSGREVVSVWDWFSSAPAARSPMVRTQATSAVTAISCAWADAPGEATAWAVSAYFTAARAFNPANRASTPAAPERMSRHVSPRPRNGSASDDTAEPDPLSTESSTETAAMMSSYAFATAAFLMSPSSSEGLTFKRRGISGKWPNGIGSLD